MDKMCHDGVDSRRYSLCAVYVQVHQVLRHRDSCENLLKLEQGVERSRFAELVSG